MSQCVNYMLREYTEEMESSSLLLSQVSQVIRAASGDPWHSTRTYHHNGLHCKMHRINFLMKILYWVSEPNSPDKCHWATSLPAHQHRAFKADGRAKHLQRYSLLISDTSHKKKIKIGPLSVKHDSTLDFSLMIFCSLEADMTGTLLNSKNKM